jgi:tetratricopeptide (TPR) repeat protein
MGLNSSLNKPMTLSLEPMEGEPEQSQSAPKTSAPEAGVAAPEKKLIDQAEHEFDNGAINQALWVRVLAKAGGDKSAAKTAYLRARARELSLPGRTGGVAGAVHDVRRSTVQEAGSAPRRAVASRPEEPPFDAEPQPKSKRPLVIGAAATVAAIAIAVAGWAAMRHESVEPVQPAVAAPVQTPAVATAPTEDKTIPREDFAARCRDLAQAGNWNMLVIYASEWTRKEPANAAAFVQLSTGYIKLRQLNDALQAANKAVKLAPQDAMVWRNIGELNVAMREPVQALAAFEQAAALDERDAYSLAQAGKLNAQLDHPAQAQLAYDRALAVNPDNVDALCGGMALAQKSGRARDAEALSAKLSELAATCQFSTDQGTVVVKRPMPDKLVRASGR